MMNTHGTEMRLGGRLGRHRHGEARRGTAGVTIIHFAFLRHELLAPFSRPIKNATSVSRKMGCGLGDFSLFPALGGAGVGGGALAGSSVRPSAAPTEFRNFENRDASDC